MFELEVDFRHLNIEDVPGEVISAFQEQTPYLDDIVSISLLQWEEHCTECAMPTCYKTCDLYQPRKDGKCRRFKHGISPVNGIRGRALPIVRIDFKRWGALMATNRLALADKNKLIKLEKSVNKIENLARAIPDHHISVFGRRGISSRLTTRYKNWLSGKFIADEKIDIAPSGFLIEVYNPNEQSADLTFVIRATEGDKSFLPYQNRLILEPGYSRIILDYADIEPHIDSERKHFVSITPNLMDACDSELSLYFGSMGLFRYTDAKSSKTEKSVKVLVWDLDNTIWDGILLEDGPDGITLKPRIPSIIKELDRRGIVNSVISKNDHDSAWSQLEKLDLSEYLLFPQINWLPKSQSMGSIIADFNVGEETIVFIDDSPFERAEVSARFPQIRTIDAHEYMDILGWPEFNPRISTESSLRREFYQHQGARNLALNEFSGEYLEFVKSCNIKIIITPGRVNNLDRIHELVQRTNQLNFSGNRYLKKDLEMILSDNQKDTFTLKCTDRFGDYGTVGFCVVDTTTYTLIDLAFSCRIQSKRIEHAFLHWLLAHYRSSGTPQFTALYRQTEKNMPAGKVFSDLGFDIKSKNDDVIEYTYPYSKGLTNESLIDITFKP
jgi:FkbH-like protein